MLFREEIDSENISSKSDEYILYLSVSNPTVFIALLERYQQVFFRKAVGIIGNSDDAEDIVQDTFIKIYKNAENFKPKEGASFKSWGYKILLNTSFTYYKKLKKRKEEFVDIPNEFYDLIPDINSDEQSKKEIKDVVASVLSKMPKRLLDVLHLHFLEGMKHKDIAKKEKISISAVKSRIHKAKKTFKKLSDKL